MLSLFEVRYFKREQIYLYIINFNGNMGQKLGKMNLIKYDLSLPTRNPQNLK